MNERYFICCDKCKEVMLVGIRENIDGTCVSSFLVQHPYGLIIPETDDRLEGFTRVN